MGKGDRRSKPKLPTLAKAPRKRANGRRKEYNEGANDARKVALDARCVMFGIEPNAKNRKRMSVQHAVGQLGFVLEHECRGEQLRNLWDTWQGYEGARLTYRKRILGTTGTAKGAAITMLPEKMETDKSFAVDLRSTEERDDHAKARWAEWTRRIAKLSISQRRLIEDVSEQHDGALYVDGRPTAKGRNTMRALMALADQGE